MKSALKKFLRENHITQSELSAGMKLGQSQISDMINGKRRPDRLYDYLNDKYGTDFSDSPEPVADVHRVENQEIRPYHTNSNGIRFYEQQDGQLSMQVPLVK